MDKHQRMWRIAQVAGVLVVSAGGILSNAIAANSFDEKAYTQEVASRIALALPQVKVSVNGPLTVKVDKPGGVNLLQANLDRVFAVCQSSPDVCESATGNYVNALSQILEDMTRPLDTSMLRLTVRPLDVLAGAQSSLPSAAPRLIQRPFVGSLGMAVVVDLPSSMRMFSADDAKALDVSEAAAIEVARKNLRVDLRPLADYEWPSAPGSLGLISDSPYESSRLLLHDDWAPVAEALDGNLVVAIPASDALVYGRGDTEEALGALRTLVDDVTRRAERPISKTLFRWTSAGWEVVR